MSKQSRVITTVLSPAVRFWLRSQLEQVEDLQLEIQSGDRQILSGYITQVSIFAQKAVYRGLHLSQVGLVGEQIRTNLRQVLRGQPLRLLESFPIAGEVLLNQADLNASLQAPLLATAVTDFLLDLLKSSREVSGELFQTPQTFYLKDPQIFIEAGRVTFSAQLRSTDSLTPVILQTGMILASPNQLRLYPLQWQLAQASPSGGFSLDNPEEFEIDLGSDVYLEELTLEAGQIRCRGQITVMPDA
ncbi:MAG: DUF2993 domain-containing protein [Kovacikia sp.]